MREFPKTGPRPGAMAFLAVLCLATPLGAEEADPRDLPIVSAVVKKTLEFERTGVEIPWTNPETGNGGVVKVERTYYLKPDMPCRDYMRTTDLPSGDPVVTRGTGCRMADARWLLDETDPPPAPTAERSAPAPGPAPKPDAAAKPTRTAAKDSAGSPPAGSPPTGSPPTGSPPSGSPPAGAARPDAGTAGAAGKHAAVGKPAPAPKPAARDVPPPPTKPAVFVPSYTMPERSGF